MPPPRLLGQPELLDQPGHDKGELTRCLGDLARVNRLFGGTRVVLLHLERVLRDVRSLLPIQLLDAATGFADIPRAIVRWARKRGLEVEIDALDRHPDICRIAIEASAAYPEIDVAQGDALQLPYPDGSFDVVLASLVLHHLEGDAPRRLLSELHRVARRAVIVNDIRRGGWPWLVSWAALHLVSRNRMIRHDGPLSVRRGFLPGELESLAREAGWTHARVARHAFFRLALVGEKQPGPAPPAPSSP